MCCFCKTFNKIKTHRNGITRNGELLRSIDKVNAGDVITIKFPDEEISVEPTEGKLDVLFENKNILAVNKPPFMPVHPVHDHILIRLQI